MKPGIWLTIVAILFLAVPGRIASAADAALPDPSFMSAHFLDIPYADKSGAQKLDIYLPKQGEKPYPVVLRIHGNTAKATDKRSRIAAYANPLLKNGYAVVSTDYRYSSEAIFTARIYDVKAAVRYIKAVAEDYDLDTHHIIAWGESTGGTLAALLAVSGDEEVLEDLGLGNPDQSSRIYGAVIWWGVFNFLEPKGQPSRASNDDTSKSKPAQGSGISVPGPAAHLDPATYISVDDPPFLIQHGTKDAQVPVQQAIAYAAELEKVLGSEMVSFDLLEGAVHEDPAFFFPDNMEKVLNFFDTWTD